MVRRLEHGSSIEGESQEVNEESDMAAARRAQIELPVTLSVELQNSDGCRLKKLVWVGLGRLQRLGALFEFGGFVIAAELAEGLRFGSQVLDEVGGCLLQTGFPPRRPCGRDMRRTFRD